jgi:hypothetical protein
MFTTQLDNLRQYILRQLTAFEFSYVFILYGFDLINQDGKPSLDSVKNMKNWFETHLTKQELQKCDEDFTYHYQIPQFVIVTIPEVSFDI